MANFKKHIGWGVFIGISFIVTSLMYSIISGVESISLIFLAVLIGSFLPDLDMDKGLPFQIIFGLLGAVFAGLVFLNLYQGGERDWKKMVLIVVVTFLAVRFVGGIIFENFTNHRGMFHSVPAAILSGLGIIWMFKYFSIENYSGFFVGLAISVGYMGHLILDEIYSSVNLSGHSLLPKQSMGSALKLYSSSRIATVFVYGTIIFLIISMPDLKESIVDLYAKMIT